MLYRGLADLIFLLHFGFVLFVVFGGILVVYRRFFLYLHLPALFWGILIEFFQIACPLTDLENNLRRLGGEAGYSGGFVEYYITAILYPSITPQFQMFLGLILVTFNLLVYSIVIIRRNRKSLD